MGLKASQIYKWNWDMLRKERAKLPDGSVSQSQNCLIDALDSSQDFISAEDQRQFFSSQPEHESSEDYSEPELLLMVDEESFKQSVSLREELSSHHVEDDDVEMDALSTKPVKS